MSFLFDLSLVETLNGGDFEKRGIDLRVTSNWKNMPYLAMFGGNIEQSTSQGVPENGQRYDFWANSVLWPEDPGLQFNSRTERTLYSVALNEDGLDQIEGAMLEDLAFMEDFAQIEVSARLIDVDTVELLLIATEPDNLQEAEFRYIWRAQQGTLDVSDFDVNIFGAQAQDFAHTDWASNDFA